MKTIALLSIVAIFITGFSSCKLDNVKPKQAIKSVTSGVQSDTSSSLINNMALVGTWNIVTDTVSFQADSMYHGQSGDHYIFTKYGNIYINSALNKYIDTGVYSISLNNDTVKWINSYISEGGGYTRGPTSVGPFVISGLTNNSLTLTQYALTPDGPRYEQVVFKKAQ